VRYYWGDHLGTTRIVTDAAGNVCYDADFYPFQGERAPYVSNCTPAYKFAGMKFDQESGNYYTLNRYYPPNLGRWLSPDPLAGSILNPQSLNRYAYVLNSPTNFVDPLGLDIWCNTLIDENGNVVGYTNCIDTGTTVYGGGPDGGAGGLRGGGFGLYGGGGGGRFAPRYQSTDSGPLIKPGGSRRTGVHQGTEQRLAEEAQGLETLVVGLNTLTTPFQNADEGFKIGSWNVWNPSRESCGRAKDFALGAMIFGGGIVAVGVMFPPAAPVTEVIGWPTAGVGAVFGVYYVAFCGPG
jgi:RHS repeat-associated protein